MVGWSCPTARQAVVFIFTASFPRTPPSTPKQRNVMADQARKCTSQRMESIIAKLKARSQSNPTSTVSQKSYTYRIVHGGKALRYGVFSHSVDVLTDNVESHLAKLPCYGNVEGNNTSQINPLFNLVVIR